MPNDQNNQSLTIAQQRHLALQRPSSLVQRGLASMANLERIIHFPEDREVGLLHFDGKWVKAKGEVRVPRTSEIKLELDDVENLAFLGKLGTKDIQSLTCNDYFSITDAELEYVAKLSKLTTLRLSLWKHITDIGLAYISNLSQLTLLELDGCSCEITDDGLAHLAKLLHLTTLHLNFGEDLITDDGLAHLAKLLQLTTLYLDFGDYGGDSITDIGLAHLSQLKKLTALGINGFSSDITDIGLAYLTDNLSQLTSLTLGGCHITDIGLAYLTDNLSQLTSLNISCGYDITDDGLAHLAKLPKLASLRLRGTKITSNLLMNLSKIPQLTELDVQGSDYDINFCYGIGGNSMDTGLAYFAGILPKLTWLDISGRQDISDAGLAHLVVKMPQLEGLDIRYCGQITDVGLAHLAKLPKLRLRSEGCKNITDAAIAAFDARR